MREDGLWGQWRTGALVIRSLAHVSVAAESSHGRSRRTRLTLLAYSLTLDFWVATRTRTTRRRPLLETALGVFDAAAWSALTRDDPVHMRSITFATIAPNLMETAFRLRAGTTAVPVVEPPLPWESPLAPLRRTTPLDVPPRREAMNAATSRSESRNGAATLSDDGRTEPVILVTRRGLRQAFQRSLQLGAHLCADAAPTLAAMTLIRRRRGLRVGKGPLGWAAIASVGGFFLARIRDLAQADTTRVWEQRTAYLIAEARVRSRVQSALVHNVTDVDPKALLTYLERAGSTVAAEILDAIDNAPHAAVSDAQEYGITLSAAVDLRRIVPEHFRTRWVSRSQVRAIRDAMADIDGQLGLISDDAPSDDDVTVVSADAQLIVLSYRGHPIELAQPVPDLAFRLEPTLWPVVTSAVLTALTAAPSNQDRPSAPALVSALTLHGIALFRLLRAAPIERHADRATAALTLASAVIMDVSIGRHTTGHRVDPNSGEFIEECPGTSATQSVMFLLGTSWGDLRTEAPFMLAAAVMAWLYSLRLDEGRSLHSLLSEASFLAMPLLANLGADRRSHAEAVLLDDLLSERLSAEIAEAARVEAAAEIAQFRRQLDGVITELPRLHPGLTDEEVAEIVATYEAEAARVDATDPLELIGW